jgi:C1A family cysteine protease
MNCKYNLKVVKMPPENLRLSAPKPIVNNLPVSVDLRSKMPPVYHQGDLGSCTANVFVACVQHADPAFYGSRLFVYYNTNLIEGNVVIDDGATLEDGIKALEKYGVCSESIWPYNVKRFSLKPTSQCYTNGLKHRVLTATNIPNTARSMKQTLASRLPIVCGIMVYESFEASSVSKTGIVPMPGPKEQLLGGHAVLVVGYDDRRQRWIMRNSWGSRWGDKGYFYLPYAYLLNDNYCTDMWVLTNITKDV